jgi:hypothetical protein
MFELYKKVLGYGRYLPQVLVPYIRDELEKHGLRVPLETSDDLLKLPIEAVPIAAAYLQRKLDSQKPIDVDRIASLVYKKAV